MNHGKCAKTKDSKANSPTTYQNVWQTDIYGATALVWHTDNGAHIMAYTRPIHLCLLHCLV